MNRYNGSKSHRIHVIHIDPDKKVRVPLGDELSGVILKVLWKTLNGDPGYFAGNCNFGNAGEFSQYKIHRVVPFV